MRAVLVVLGVAIASPTSAATIHGLVYDDVNRDGKPSAGEPGVANAVVALGTRGFVTTNANGQFDIEVADDARGIVWVRVPDGFTPGPVFARWDGKTDVDLGLQRVKSPPRGPLTFVVAADTHIPITEENFGAADLARVAALATALEPAPAFFTVLGDITQGSRDGEYELVKRGLADVDVPWIPVPGNHDWYDAGEAWFKHFGPDNYSFDIGGAHFIVLNMTLDPGELRAFLGGELHRVAPAMPVIVLTHDPPKPPAVTALRELGVDYVLTGHTHSNRVVDHGGLIELNTEPLLMGGLDFTPAGYRVITLHGERLASYRRTVVDAPVLSVIAPDVRQCVAAKDGELLIAAEVAAGATIATARIDCASPFQLRHVGGWNWRAALPPLSPGAHTLAVSVTGPRGAQASTTIAFEVCASPARPATSGPDWPQLGGSSSHRGAALHAIAPPLASRWVTAVGGHVVTAPPIIAAGIVYVAVSDLADGDTGGIVALDLATGSVRWRVRARKPIRGGLAFVPGRDAGTIVTTQIDGVVLALDAATGTRRWQREISRALPPQAGAVFSPPTVDGDSVFTGHQRALLALEPAAGAPRWIEDPVPDGLNSQSAAATAISGALAIGTFHRELGGVIAFDRATGERRWSYTGEDTVAVNASPVIGSDAIYIVSGATDVLALDFAGHRRWHRKLDPDGFAWGNASIGTPALAHGVLIVPTMYGSLVALDAATGDERWRQAARPGPLRQTHYRGAPQPAFAASPIVTDQIVWTADAAGTLSALDVRTGAVRWTTPLGVPVLAGLAASGDWLVVASYDGSVRGFAPTAATRAALRPTTPVCTAEVPAAGCCQSGAPHAGWLAAIVLLLIRRRVRV